MRRDELHFFQVPPERIAQQPVEPRDQSRLLVVDRAGGSLTHRRFADLPEYLRAGDLLVRNDSQVIPARFFARRASGGRVEGLFLHEPEPGCWRTLLKPAARLRVGESLEVPGTVQRLELLERHERGEWTARLTPPAAAVDVLRAVGHPPLPPYIRGGEAEAADLQSYQTVYARRPGSIAAPTAGLHFTPGLLARVAAAGVSIADVTLHVGLGTFLGVETEELADHPMHAEWYEVDAAAAGALERAGRVIAVGTTACRTLESWARPPLAAGTGSRTGTHSGGPGGPSSGWTRLFIYPPYRFARVDALLTNFHLPGSTLIALVMAFAGRELTHAAYAAALAGGYRFFSYGDAMLIV